MKKILSFFVFFLILPLSVLAMSSNRELNSPSGKYVFTLKDIQETVRAALYKADDVIASLEKSQEIQQIAYLFFKDYLETIGSYNEIQPQTVDLIESYKTELVNAFVLKEFKDKWPHLIFDRSKWMFNSVGTIYANMIVLFCTDKEYIVLWGTSVQADNKFSGYYSYMNEFDTMTRGIMISHDVDAPGHAPVIYKPIIQDGIVSTTVDTSNLIPGNIRAYSLGSHTYMVSYAQGSIPKAFLPGAIMPGVFVNQDWGGLKLHITECLKAMKQVIKAKEPKEDAWRRNENYRAIWIIDDFRQGYFEENK